MLLSLRPVSSFSIKF